MNSFRPTKNPAVFYSAARDARWTSRELAWLKSRAGNAPRGRARACAHSGASDPVHEMLIALPRGAYVRPHLHRTRAESYVFLDGRAEILLFDARGRVAERIPVGPPSSRRVFYYRQPANRYHGLRVLSPRLVFLEVRPGPWDKRDTVQAPWAPEDADVGAAQAFVRRMR